jgi:ribonuclease P protein component
VRRRDRLSGSRQFAAVRAVRISAGSGALRVAMAPNGLEHARLGFAIPKGVGGAVVRNTVRRRLRAALQPRRAELAGFDVVVSTSPEAATQTFAQLDADLARCLERALPTARARAVQPGSARRRRLAENGAIGPGPRRAFAPSGL